MNLYQILVKPVVTEKTAREGEQGKYTFVVNGLANKIEIGKAVEALYGVKVVSVSVRQTPKKTRLIGRGREITKRASAKKATVTLEKGKTLDLAKFKAVK